MVETLNKPKVLVVEDDQDALFLIGQILRQLAYPHVLTNRATDARAILASEAFDVAIIDIGLPDESGLEVLRWARCEPSGCEVVMLTGRPDVKTAIQALRDGAIDYLTKPVTTQMLAASLERVAGRLQVTQQRREALNLLETGLRHFTGQRSAAAPPAAAPAPPARAPRQFRVGPVLLDLDRFVIEVGGASVHATPSEIEILHYLCQNPGRVITPQEIVHSIRGYHVEARQAPEIIRPHISNLRRKLAAAAPEADVVRTVRGVGYMLREPGGAGDE